MGSTPSTCKLWTILPEPTWNALNRESVLFPDANYIEPCGYALAYKWMGEQFESRTGIALATPQSMWWFYHHWHNGEGTGRPDLRVLRHRKSGTFYLIEIEKSTSEILKSNFHAWESVMFGDHVSRTEEDETRWYDTYWRDKPAPPSVFRNEIDHTTGHMYQTWETEIDPVFKRALMDTWKWIFDLDACRDYNGYKTQAVSHILRLDEVKDVWRFDGTKKV